ncbi:MAG TPA: FkbM family methyltransferase [Actinophytocola sp.]|uniref:FkbM family methyltransferase n=1 Tax=Actinophytocola sp. TaxID=1872138 RepID=UPI002E0B99D7|nr:FkbM family methyltransferase [Actinophytocola sp.]
MISYAQNAEDVVLARLFAGQRTGRYVDIGAGDPIEASVTKHFYDHGWRGLNIEPIPFLAERLRADRPEDVTLAVAVGAKSGSAVLHVVGHEWGWSTLDDQLAQGYRDEQQWDVSEIEVELVTLAAVLDDHPGPVDFLKIDVEGAEQDVIDGADWARHRPRVIVIEATEPGAPTPAHHQWEPVLLDAGYRCALFDGLNRFYAQAEDGEALTRLAAPANVFDSFEPYTWQFKLDERAADKGYIRRLETMLREAQEARAKDADRIRELESALAEERRRSTRARRAEAALARRLAELEIREP